MHISITPEFYILNKSRNYKMKIFNGHVCGNSNVLRLKAGSHFYTLTRQIIQKLISILTLDVIDSILLSHTTLT